MMRFENTMQRAVIQMNGVEELIQKLRTGMDIFTKAMAETLRPFYNWTQAKAEAAGMELEEV